MSAVLTLVTPPMAPCPFCHGTNLRVAATQNTPPLKYAVRVLCTGCKCHGPKALNKHAAIVEWNKRADQVDSRRFRKFIEVGFNDDFDAYDVEGLIYQLDALIAQDDR